MPGMANRGPFNVDEIRGAALQVGMGLLRTVVATGGRAAAKAYDSVLEDIEHTLRGGAETIKKKRSRVSRKAEQLDEE